MPDDNQPAESQSLPHAAAGLPHEPPLPPLLDYPSRPPPPEPETERWSDVLRAALIVFGSIAILFFGVFGLCGLAGRGCG